MANHSEISSVRPILELNNFQATEGAHSGAAMRRLANVGASSVLFYRDPIEMVAAEGTWMIAKDGTRYLDVYNNVPVVGHCHPEVVEAVHRQMAKLNTHSRYLVEELDNFLEALKATFPGSLDNIILTCTGSEANDLALRIAREVSGGAGFIVSENAYHGGTALTTDVSPSSLRNAVLPDYVVTVPAPSETNFGSDIANGFATAVTEAIATLKSRAIAPAALILDSIFSSDGVFADPAGFIKLAVEVIRRAGGLYIADEVQPGFARTGDAFWGFQRHGVEPDMVSMSKPMGNGFPIAGLAVRPDYLAAFCRRFGYFNTFGGNPVAAVAGHTTLRIIQRDGLQENARVVGAHVKDRLQRIANAHPRMSGVRGAGLFIGVDFTADGQPDTPDSAFAVGMVDALRRKNVLIGMAGKYAATLRVRPPLCMTLDEGDLFVEAFQQALQSM